MGDSILHFLFDEDGLDHKAGIDYLVVIQHLGISECLVIVNCIMNRCQAQDPASDLSAKQHFKWSTSSGFPRGPSSFLGPLRGLLRSCG